MSTEAKTYSAKLMQLGRRHIPTRALFEVTGRCNASCRYCYLEKQRARAHDLSMDQVCAVLAKLDEAGVMKITITGGEPFLRPDILRILRESVQRFFQIIILTNGTLLQPDHIVFLGEHRACIPGISLSLFSHHAKINDAYFGVPGATRTILANAEALQKAGCNVMFKIHVLDFNMETFEETRSFLEEHGFYARVSPRLLCAPDGDPEYLNQFCTLAFMQRFVYNLREEEKATYRDTIEGLATAYHAGQSFCRGIFTSVAVDWKGNVRPCIAFRELILGNILGPVPLRKLLADSAELRRVQALSREKVAMCRDCKQKERCGVCVGNFYNNDPSLRTPPPGECRLMQALFEGIREAV